MNIIDIEYAKEKLDYNPDTGLLSWKESHRNRKKGDIVACKCRGYLRVRLKGTSFQAHRIAWAMHYGIQPIEIDHINMVKDDNRISNLRECTHSQNNANRPTCKSNKSGAKGVCWHKKTEKWMAKMTKDNKSIHLGLFENIEDAAQAYAEAAKKYHGEFMRLSA